MEGCIYLITCLINGKKYVGQHHKPDPTSRWNAHISRAKKGLAYVLHNAIRLFGEENFKFEVLCVCSHDALGRLEAYYAEQYESYIWDPDPGYNMVWCGEQSTLGMKHTPETIEKIRQAHLGKKMSPETIEKKRRKQTPEVIEKRRQALLGKKHTPERIEKVRQANLGKKRSPEAIEKNRQAQLGKKRSPEVIEKIKEAWVRRKAAQSLSV